MTRPSDQSVTLVKLLDQLGARAIAAPAIEIVPARSAALTHGLKGLAAGEFAWITLTSRATVDVLASRLGGPEDVRARVAVIGDGTASVFRRWARREPDLQPTTFTTAALARAFPVGEVASSARARTSRPKVWNPHSPRKVGPPSASTPTARACRTRCRRRPAPR